MSSPPPFFFPALFPRRAPTTRANPPLPLDPKTKEGGDFLKKVGEGPVVVPKNFRSGVAKRKRRIF